MLKKTHNTQVLSNVSRVQCAVACNHHPIPGLFSLLKNIWPAYHPGCQLVHKRRARVFNDIFYYFKPVFSSYLGERPHQT